MKLYTITPLDLSDVQHMRNIRAQCVFSIVNRGQLWYAQLTPQQLAELEAWYLAWLAFPESGVLPETPAWLENEIQYEIKLT